MQTKNWKVGKNLPKLDSHMYNFIKQNYIEVERGVEYRNYQKEVVRLMDFWQKRRLKDPKMKKLIEKSQKITKKLRIMCQFGTWNAS